MKILMVSEDVPNPHLGGLGKHALNLAIELRRRGHTVDFLGNGDYSIEQFPDQAGPGRFFGEISGHSRGWKERHIGAFTAWRTVLNGRSVTGAIMARAAGYDVVHYHGHLPWIAGNIPSDVPFIQTRHDQGGDCMLKTRFRPTGGRCVSTDPGDCANCATSHPNVMQRQLTSLSVRHLRRRTTEAYQQHPVIFVSGFLQAAFAKVSAKGPLGHVIHNAVDANALNAALAAKASIDGDEGRFPVELFSAGAMLAYKGFGQLLLALRQRPLPPGVRLTLAGAGPLLETLRLAYESTNVRFTGWMAYADVVRHVAAADAVVVPSEWDEPCATTALEALALGKSVFALRRGGTPELMGYILPGAGTLHLFDSLDTLVAAMSVQPPVKGADPVSVLPTFDWTIQAMADKVLAQYAKFIRISA